MYFWDIFGLQVYELFKAITGVGNSELYSKSTYHDFRNEKKMGCLAQKNNITRHINECFDVIYKTNNYMQDSEFSIKKYWNN